MGERLERVVLAVAADEVGVDDVTRGQLLRPHAEGDQPGARRARRGPAGRRCCGTAPLRDFLFVRRPRSSAPRSAPRRRRWPEQVGAAELRVVEQGAVVDGEQHLPVALAPGGADPGTVGVDRAQRDQGGRPGWRLRRASSSRPDSRRGTPGRSSSSSARAPDVVAELVGDLGGRSAPARGSRRRAGRVRRRAPAAARPATTATARPAR